MVGHLSVIIQVSKIMQHGKDGAIGKLRHIRLSRIAPGRFGSESVLFDLCPHDLALVAALTDQADPTTVNSHGLPFRGSMTYATTHLDFADG